MLFTETELAGREFVKGIMKDNGLEVTEDAAGNIFGKLAGTDPSLAPVWTGSHIDTVLNGGMFDGMAGVIGGIEALRIIKESGIRPKRDVYVIVYMSEEPTRFGLSCLGSRIMSGDMSLEDTKGVFDKECWRVWVMTFRNFPVSEGKRVMFLRQWKCILNRVLTLKRTADR